MSPNAHVLRFDEITAIDRGTGVKTVPLAGKWIDSATLTNGVTSFEPGAAIALHYHNCDESVTILEGEAFCEIDGEVFQIKALDTAFIPAGHPTPLLECERSPHENCVDLCISQRNTHVRRDWRNGRTSVDGGSGSR